MAYESPISVWWSDTKIEQLRDEYDNVIVKAVKNCYPQVDKDELLKALRYDREQYEKGYRDGRLYQPPVLTNADRIRALSDEELADEILSWFNWLNAVEWNDKRILDWLRQEVEK